MGVEREDVVHRLVGRRQELLDVARRLADAVFVLDECEANIIVTHLAEAGVPLPLLMAKSRHTSLRTLQRYARPDVDAVARVTADNDPAARRR